MNIAVVGAGNVGSGLGRLWAERGHKVIFTFSRNIERLRELARGIPNTEVLEPEDAVKKSEAVLLSVRWANVPEAINACGALSGKVLIDCTNPLKPDLSGLLIGHTTSAAEEIQHLAPEAIVVKAFNTVFAEIYHAESRLFGTRRLTMFYAGDDKKAKSLVAGLISDVGFEPIDAGKLIAARYLEPLAMLMVHLGYVQGMGTKIGLNLLRR